MRLIDADELYQNIDTTLNPYDKPSIVIKQEMLERINLAPTVEPKHGEWIPVSERLPEEKINPNTRDFEEVLCTTTWGDVRPYKYGKPIGHDKAHFWHGFGIMDKEVIAWMPLPEPYKEEGEAE